MSVDYTTINQLQRLCEAVDDIIVATEPRGALCNVKRRRVAQVRRIAKQLRKALGDMIADNSTLRSTLPEFTTSTEETP